MKEIRVKTIAQTNALASHVAQLLEGNGCVCLAGDLGAGKTTFTKALGKAIGIEDVITSPTFTIMKLYDGMIPLCHIDAYRLEGLHQDLGFEETLEEGISVIEWYQYMQADLPKERLEIEIILDNDERVFKIQGIGTRYERIEGEL